MRIVINGDYLDAATTFYRKHDAKIWLAVCLGVSVMFPIVGFIIAGIAAGAVARIIWNKRQYNKARKMPVVWK